MHSDEAGKVLTAHGADDLPAAAAAAATVHGARAELQGVGVVRVV